MATIQYSIDMKRASDERRLYNVKAFSSLDRNGLSLGSVERLLLINEFKSGEKIYIHYPGKEAVARGSSPARPWDFRPKLQLADGTWLPDLSFKNIWDDLFALKETKMDMSIIATLFFRMAFMLDTEKVTRTLPYKDFDANDEIINAGTLQLSWYEYTPATDLIELLTESICTPRNCSLEAYLAYNDLLAQNEDCKYYYRDEIQNGGSWNTNVGRRNTLLTHMTIISFMEDQLTFTQIMDMFQHGSGVAALQAKNWEAVTNSRVIK